MKKIIILSIFLMLTLVAFAQTPGRTVYQKLALDPAHPMLIEDYVTNTGTTHSEHYILRVLHVDSGEEKGTDTGISPAAFRVVKTGPASNQYIVATFNQSQFSAVWPAGSHVKMRIWHAHDTGIHSGVEPYPNYEYVEKTIEVPTGGGAILLQGDDDILIIPPAPPVTPEFEFFVNSNYPDAAIYRDGVDTGEVTPYTFVGETDELAGVYSLVLENVVWTPESYSYDGLADHTITFEGVMTPGYASNPVPANEAEITIAWDADPVAYDLEWDAPALAPTGYKVFWMGEEVGSITETTWTTPAIAEGSYNWKVVPYITDPVLGKSVGSRNMAPVQARFSAPALKGEVTDAPLWSFTIVREAAPEYSLVVTSIPSELPIYKDDIDTGEVTPFTFTGITEDVLGIYHVELEGYSFEPEYYEFDGDADESVEFVGTKDPDIPADGDAELQDGITLETDADLFIVPIDIDTNAYIAMLPNITANASAYGYTGSSNDASINIIVSEAGTWYVMAYYNGAWHNAPAAQWPLIVPPTGTVTFSGIDFTAKGDVIIVISEDDEPTLPVELSSFNAVLTASNFVKLTWISQSETEMLGYRVYRSESSDQSASLLLTPSMVAATNTSSTQVYDLEDNEVEIGSTYWYWLESVDYASSHFHGPVSVIVTGEVPPVLPTVTSMSNAYPNPFKQVSSTSIDVSIKAGENGTVTIYNILGQAVKTFKVSEGSHKLSWNGKDARGNNCGSGIYFYKLSTPSTNMTKKMVIVK